MLPQYLIIKMGGILDTNRWSKCSIYNTQKFLRFIILHLRVNVHSRLTVFMPGKILNSFWVNACIQQVSNIGVTKLMWGYIKVNGIH